MAYSDPERGQLGLGHVLDELNPCELKPPPPLLSWKVQTYFMIRTVAVTEIHLRFHNLPVSLSPPAPVCFGGCFD